MLKGRRTTRSQSRFQPSTRQLDSRHAPYGERPGSPSLASSSGSVHIAGNAIDFPIFLATREIVTLYEKRDPNSTRRNSLYEVWLNETTVDAIVMYAKQMDVIPDVPKPLYLGSSFNKRSLSSASNDYVCKLRSALKYHGILAMVVNTGQHWSLLTFYNDPKMCTLTDPMASSSVALSIIHFAARIYDRTDELCERLGGDHFLSSSAVLNQDREISVRTQLSNFHLSFFSLENVGVQLAEAEGYNCGMYCALWARSLIHKHCISSESIFSDHSFRCYNKANLLDKRKLWQDRLSAGGATYLSPRLLSSTSFPIKRRLIVDSGLAKTLPRSLVRLAV
eukprot:TRINITY_DN11173_c0_g1_i1.p1 TRINITY_DN11173_c0_g1~~TRINITY_DN11173_c0_g1_i1.p1  ORF type:complete len:336 (+),score=59.37 TRINITY_DN11173_c0_g1_i1:186-1193(+)